MTEPKTLHYGLWDGSSTILCSYVLIFTLICIKRKEFPHIFMLFVPISAILLTFFYLPVSCNILLSHMPGGMGGITQQIQVLRRFRWIFLILPILTFGLTYIFLISKPILNKAFIIIALVFMAFISVYGSDWTARGAKSGFWDRSNTMDHLYKIPNISIAMGDTLIEENTDFFAEDRRNYIILIAADDDSQGWHHDGKNSLYFVRCLREYLSPVQYKKINLSDKECMSNIDGFEEYTLCPDTNEAITMFRNQGFTVKWKMDGYCFMKKGA